MKNLFPLMQTKIVFAIGFLLIVSLAVIGYRGVYKIANEKQELNRRLEFAKAALAKDQEILKSSRESWQWLTQNKQQVIQDKGELWYQSYRQEIENNMVNSQKGVQEDLQTIQTIKQRLRKLEDYPLSFAF